jgi:predicted transposase/invertase (TIGR01784 family)
MLAEEREKYRRDYVSRMNGARREGRAEGHTEGRTDVARNLLKMNMPIEQIIDATGLTRDEVEALYVQR